MKTRVLPSGSSHVRLRHESVKAALASSQLYLLGRQTVLVTAVFTSTIGVQPRKPAGQDANQQLLGCITKAPHYGYPLAGKMGDRDIRCSTYRNRCMISPLGCSGCHSYSLYRTDCYRGEREAVLRKQGTHCRRILSDQKDKIFFRASKGFELEVGSQDN
ncbi:hypothetical protein B0O99DRAFT_228766 [Bisporella sp. PMI_857]|nr:hypothetical protein B0O99DRAFT_228766 [Bisporella sp. PMI_857]